MPVAVAGGDSTVAYACHCLNVRMNTATTETAPPDSVDDPAFSKVFVGEAIEIHHPQLTLRFRKRVAPIPGNNRYSRYRTLKCLSCNIPVYRIFQTFTGDAEGKDGPILPFEDYVEKEVLKSSNGWVEVNKDLLTNEAILRAESEKQYSSIFSLVIPPLPEVPENPRAKDISQEPRRSRSPSPEPTPSYLHHLKPILQPPPFTPSHPAFQHLAQFALKESQDRRAAAEQCITEFIQKKAAEIEQGDAATKQLVDVLWHRYKNSIKEAHGEAPYSPRTNMRRASRSRERRSARSVSPSNFGTPVAVKNFVPVSGMTRVSSSVSQQQSALSASLVTSSFHHPKAQNNAAAAQSTESPDSESGRTLSIADSATLVQSASQVPGDGVNILSYRRNVDDTINTQASFRYFQNLEEGMAAAKGKREAAKAAETSKSAKQDASTGTAGATNEGSQAIKSSSSSNPVDQPEKAESAEPTGSHPPRGRQGKGKRKVTFDVEPDASGLRKEDTTSTVQGQPQGQNDGGSMMFPIEDLEGEDDSTSQAGQTLPLLEQQPSRLSRVVKPRPQVIPESLAGLRPSSLPAPSQLHIRPIRSPPAVEGTMMISLPQQANPLASGRRPPRVNGPISPTKGGEVNTQRGVWSADGQNWHSFIRAVPATQPTSIPEENEAEVGTEAVIEVEHSTPQQQHITFAPAPRLVKAAPPRDESSDDEDFVVRAYDHGVPSSAPVQIHLKAKTRVPLSLASYQPKAVIAGKPASDGEEQVVESTVNGKHKTSSRAILKAVYAERDRERSMDPGPMDFNQDDDEDDDSDDDEEEDGGVGSGSQDEQDRERVEKFLSTSRGRKHALKIIQARSKLPDSGMWRSLAS